MTRSTWIRRGVIAAFALTIAATAIGPAAEAAPLRATVPGPSDVSEGPLIEVHDRWGHHRRHHHKHWKKHQRHYDNRNYSDERPVIVERYRYVERYPEPRYYYYNPLDSLFDALVFNFSFDGDRHSHRRHHGHRRHRD